MTVSKTKYTSVTRTSNAAISLPKQSEMTQAMQRIEQSTEKVATNLAGFSAKQAPQLQQDDDVGAAAEVLKALGIEEKPFEPFVMPEHGYSPYYFDDDEPFDATLISPTFESSYPGEPWYYGYDYYFAPSVHGLHTGKGAISVAIVRHPPDLLHKLIDVAVKHGGKVGNIYTDERGRQSVEITKMTTRAKDEFQSVAKACHEKIEERREKGKKARRKQQYKRQVQLLAEKKASTPSKKEEKRFAQEAKKQREAHKKDDDKLNNSQKAKGSAPRRKR